MIGFLNRFFMSCIQPVLRLAGLSAAWLFRRTRRNTCFIAITGSSGKTTAKNLLAAIVQSKGPVITNEGSMNAAGELTKTLFRVKRNDASCVQELGAGKPGGLRLLTKVFKPDISVVTCIGREHYAKFRSDDAVAAEKSALITSLPESGWAVLNRDDPHCVRMSEQTRARVMFFGLSPDADLRAEKVRAAWPDRLSFTAIYRNERVVVQTRLCGKHWITSALAAMAAGLAAGVALKDAAAALAAVEPFEGRMSPVELNDQITFIRDDWKNPAWSIAPVLNFMKEARAKRRILVLGQISDTPKKPSKLYPQLVQDAMKSAEVVILTGEWAHVVDPEIKSDTAMAFAFETVREVDDWLSQNLQSGDLVVLRGSSTTDHLERLVFNRQKKIECWRQKCGYVWYCNTCSLLYKK